MENLIRPIELRPGVILPCRIFQGPMEGVTEGAFVAAMASRNWNSIWWMPFIRISTGVPRRSKLLSKMAPYLATGCPVIAQIMGTNSELLALAARRLAELGAKVVDLNCACPSRNVISSQAGGYRLKYPEWIGDTLKMMREAIGDLPCGISVKLRMGYDSAEEFEEIAAAVRAAGPDMTAVHFRTVREMYALVADGLQRMAKIRRLLPDTFLIGCGDVKNPVSMEQMLSCGVDGVAVARELIPNPHILVELADYCHGRLPAVLTESEKLEFLNDLLAGCDLSRRGARGFVLQSAISMLGREHEFCQSLLKE